MKILTVIGARPQIIKAAAVSRAVRTRFSPVISEVIVHTGQHYDENMSRVFFGELEIPEPAYNLGVGSGTHAAQAAAMINGLEQVVTKEKPDALLLYGDTNSTLAGAIAGSKGSLPVIHVEAGLRSFNRRMPEEINRIACDHASMFLFSPTAAGVQNLAAEGLPATAPPYNANRPFVAHCGDVMYDNSLYFAALAQQRSKILDKYSLRPGQFMLVTIHRDANTDSPARLQDLFVALLEINSQYAMPVILPLHPRTRKLMEAGLSASLRERIAAAKSFILCEPLPYLDMVMLEKNCRLVATDSGGVQKEAFFFEKPCIILRDETEWVELVECGSAILAGAGPARILQAYATLTSGKALRFPRLFGDGKAAEYICEQIIKYLS